MDVWWFVSTKGTCQLGPWVPEVPRPVPLASPPASLGHGLAPPPPACCPGQAWPGHVNELINDCWSMNWVNLKKTVKVPKEYLKSELIVQISKLIILQTLFILRLPHPNLYYKRNVCPTIENDVCTISQQLKNDNVYKSLNINKLENNCKYKT